AADVFGIRAPGSSVTGGVLDRDGYAEVARRLMERFGFAMTAITLRRSVSASDNDWGAMLYANGTPFYSRTYNVHIVDRVGGGDSFAAGLIHALLRGETHGKALEFAVAASALKHSVEGDYNLVGAAEVERLAGGDGSGRVQR
ncbi:MAG TPA: PfkB family carbohydrate kinase, partial [Clostridia bacterium]|nr:PfkB family carbohydrate kinase [Clostridia bacterium]